jgi:hypothetical protein
MPKRAMWTGLLCALVFVLGSARADEVRKVFELTDGSVVVGVVLDELDTGYLVRTVEGETVRVGYDQVQRVTTLGDEAEEIPDEEEERSSSAGTRYHLSEGLSVAAGVTFGTGFTTLGVGAAFAADTLEEMPGTPIGIGGLAQLGVSMIFLGEGARYARSAATLYGLDVRPYLGVTAIGMALESTGMVMGAVAVGFGASGEWVPLELAIPAVVLGITGHILGQAGVGRARALVQEARDGTYPSTRSHEPQLRFTGLWAFRTEQTTVVGAGFSF